MSFLAPIALVVSLCLPVAAQIGLSISQPTGPGSVEIEVTGVAPNAEVFVLISSFQSFPAGSGPFLGLSLAGSDQLLTQLLSPVGVAPFHVLADGTGRYEWSLTWGPVGVMLPFDVVTFEWSALTGIVQLSPVTAITIDA